MLAERCDERKRKHGVVGMVYRLAWIREYLASDRAFAFLTVTVLRGM